MISIDSNKRFIFWNVDTQNDFMNADGKLYVSGAEEIKPTLAKITQYAKETGIQVVNTSDWHFENSEELSENPDFMNTFPPHCMSGTTGADLIAETKPVNGFDLVISWQEQVNPLKLNLSSRNILILKDKFDVFAGNPNTDAFVKALNPEVVYVYGVATNVCVNCAVLGLLDRGIEVVVFEDAIKELPGIPSPIQSWVDKGAKIVNFN
jgi:nicotinamidase/pyrazinamidase